MTAHCLDALRPHDLLIFRPEGHSCESTAGLAQRGTVSQKGLNRNLTLPGYRQAQGLVPLHTCQGPPLQEADIGQCILSFSLACFFFL